MKTLLATLMAGAAVGLLALTIVVLVQFYDHRKLSVDNQALEAELQAANQKVGELEKEQAAVVKDLESRCADVQVLTAKLAEATTLAAKTNEPPSSAVLPRPYQAPAFLGNQYLGLAWVVPRNVAKNPKTGRFTFEPALVLDPALREAFATPVTNVEVVADTPSPNYTVNNYNNPWPWLVWTPVTRRHPDWPPRLSPAGQPSSTPSSRPVPAWTPVGASIRPGPSVPPRGRQPGNDASPNSGYPGSTIPGSAPPPLRAAF